MSTASTKTARSPSSRCPAGSTALKRLPSLERTAGAARRGRLLLSHQRRGGAAQSQRGRARPHAAALDRDRRGQDRARLDRRRDRGLAGPQRHHAGQRRRERRLPQAAGPVPRPQRELPGHRRAAPGQGDHAGDVFWPRGQARPRRRCSPRAAAAPSTSIPRRRRCSLHWACPMPRSAISSRTRTNNPYPTVPGRFSGRRVDRRKHDVPDRCGRDRGRRAQGAHRRDRPEVAGSAGTPPTVTVLSWRPMPLRSPATKESGKS